MCFVKVTRSFVDSEIEKSRNLGVYEKGFFGVGPSI